MNRRTLGEVVILWLNWLPVGISSQGKPYSPKSITLYHTVMRSLLAYVPAATPLASLTGADVERWLAVKRSEGMKQGSAAIFMRVVRLFLAWCVEEKHLQHHPLERTRRVKQLEPDIERFRPEQVRAMLALCNQGRWMGARNHAIFTLLWRTGLRASELCALDVTDYDKAAGTLTVRHGKGNKRRTVGVPDDAAARLDWWLARGHRGHSSAMFNGTRSDRIDYPALRYLVAEYGVRAGIEDAHPHKFRHTFAVDFLQAGGDLYTLSRLLGHADIKTTTRYLRALQADEAAARHREIMNAL